MNEVMNCRKTRALERRLASVKRVFKNAQMTGGASFEYTGISLYYSNSGNYLPPDTTRKTMDFWIGEVKVHIVLTCDGMVGALSSKSIIDLCDFAQQVGASLRVDALEQTMQQKVRENERNLKEIERLRTMVTEIESLNIRSREKGAAIDG